MSDSEARLWRFARASPWYDEIREDAAAVLNELAAARAEAELYKRQLDAVDANLPPWEPPPGESCVGRVQTILNLRADRAEAEQLREALRQIDLEASKRAPLIVTGVGPDNHPTDRSEHRGWTLGTIRMRRVRIRKIARAALAEAAPSEP